MARRSQGDILIRLFALTLIAAVLAYITAGATICVRQASDATRQQHFPDSANQAVPLLTATQWAQAGPVAVCADRLEQICKVGAIAILAAAALGLRRQRGEGLSLLLIGLAAGGVAYTVMLRALTGWPESPGVWVVLLRHPVPWVAPLWAPLAVGGTMLIAGVIRLSRSGPDFPATRRLIPTVLIALGLAAVVASFLVRGREAVGAIPASFDWPWFLAGWLPGTAGLLCLALRPRVRRKG